MTIAQQFHHYNRYSYLEQDHLQQSWFLLVCLREVFIFINILFVKPGRGKVETNVYSTKQMQTLGLKDILFLHAFTGCDTTSAAFRKSKIGFVKNYQKYPDIREAAAVFSDPTSSHDEVWQAGHKCILRWYGATAKEKSLNFYRYQSFVKSVANVKPDISSLPPTEDAAKEHFFRVYYQVQLWLGNELLPELWGWELKKDNQLTPVPTRSLAAPDEILKLIFCRCTKDCSSAKCGCKKASLNCSTLCQNCQGNCLNGVSMLDNRDEDAEEEEVIPTSFQDEQMEDNTDEEYDEAITCTDCWTLSPQESQ